MKKKPLRVYIGWDARDHPAYTVAVKSLLRHSTIPVEIIPLVDRDLRRKGVYWRSYRVDHRGQMWDDIDGKPFSTQFSFTRFAVPLLENFSEEMVVFTDPDMLWRADIADLMRSVDPSKSITVVKHDHRPREREKIDGVLQTTYERKNWSSMMVMRPSKCQMWTKYAVNNSPGSSLHALKGMQDEEIGETGPEWNWLEGYTSPKIIPKIVHYTRGTPDMDGHEDSSFSAEWWGFYDEKKSVEYPLIRAREHTTESERAA